MPKQKIEVNENLNVSIGDILKSKISENSSPLNANEEIAQTESHREASGGKVLENSSTKKDKELSRDAKELAETTNKNMMVKDLQRHGSLSGDTESEAKRHDSVSYSSHITSHSLQGCSTYQLPSGLPLYSIEDCRHHRQ